MATTDELMNAYKSAATQSTASATETPAPTTQTSTDMVNGLYDKQLASQTGSLKSAYDQNLSNLQASQAQINPTYNEKANALANQYEIAKRNMAQQNSMNGLNSGAGSQAALAQNAAYGNSMADIRTAQANAQTEAQRQIDLLGTQYQNDVAQAAADNDYQRAVALYNDFQNRQSDLKEQAALMAQYGDYSSYGQLYGTDASSTMQKFWNYQNPDTAYKMGYVDAEGYKELTGKYPAGYKGNGSGSSGTSWYQETAKYYREALANGDAQTTDPTKDNYYPNLATWLKDSH